MLNDAYAETVAYAAFDIVVVASSAGGIQAMLSLLRHLPAGFSAPIVLAHHLPPASSYRSRLPEILRRNTPLRVRWAENGEVLRPGTVYVAPQDRNIAFNPRTGCLAVPEIAVGHTGLADPLFHSAAQVFGSRCMAVVLSGASSDGADGAAAIAQAGGRVLAQNAAEAQFMDMPLAAMKRSRVGLAFDSASLASVINGLVMMPGAANWFGIGKAGVGVGMTPLRLESSRRNFG